MTRLSPPLGDGVWQLFNLDVDPSETHDVAATEPDIVRELEASWDAYVANHGVILLPRDSGPMGQ